MTTPDVLAPRVPERTCIGCRRRAPQDRLVRCAVGPAGPTVSRTAPGRGAWLCSEMCLDTAVRRRAFDRAWRRQIEPEGVAALRIAFHGVITNMTDSSTGEARLAVAVPTKG